MFRWLTTQLRPYTVGTFGGDLIEELVPGHRDRMARMDQKCAEEDRRRDEQEARALKKDHLEQELEDAEWILEYEKRLAKLQKKAVAQRSRAEQSGINTERLRKLEHHLAGVRRSLD